MARDFRRFLATMPSDAYSDVLDVLEPYIGSALPTQQLLAAYLAPERTDWSETVVRSLNEMPRVPAWLVSRTAVSDDQGNAQLELPPLALQLVHTEAELHQIYPRVSNWSLTGESGELLAMVQWLGAAAVPAVESIAMEDDPIANLLKLAAAVLGSIPADAAMTALLRHSEDKRMRAALLESVDRYPRRALRVLAQHDPKDSQVQDLLTTRVRADRALAAEVAAELEATPSGTNEGAAAAQRITDLLSVEQVPQADPDQLPRVLVSPPWLQKRKRTKPVVIEGLDTEAGVIVEWLPGERDDYLATKPAFRAPDAKFSWGPVVDRCVKGQAKWKDFAMLLAYGPDEVLVPVLEDVRVPQYYWGAWESMRIALGRFGEVAVPLLLNAAKVRPKELADVLLPVSGAPVAALMADWDTRLKTVRPTSQAWFARHPEAAAKGLIPLAVGPAGKARKSAETTLFRLGQQGNRDGIMAAAKSFAADGLSADVAEAVGQLLDTDPLDVLPARIPATPEWLDPAALASLLTPEGMALPVEVAPHVITMLALPTLENPYAGLDDLREATDPSSLAAYAREIFQLWRIAGYPAKDGWVLEAQGLVGDDRTAAMLSPLIRAWPGEAAHKRAVQGLEVLAAVGTDAALTHLHRISRKVKFKALKTRAGELIDDIAEQLGFSSKSGSMRR